MRSSGAYWTSFHAEYQDSILPSPLHSDLKPPMQPRTRPITTRQFFAPRGPLSEWHPNFEFPARPA